MLSLLGSWARGVALGLVALAIVLGVGFLWLTAGIDEFYSPGFFSDSSAQAEAGGILVKRPVVVPATFAYGGSTVRVVDAWVERTTRIEAPFRVFRRRVVDSTQRLVIVAHRDGESACHDELFHGPLERFGGSSREGGPVWIAVRAPGIDPPWGDTVRVVAAQGATCGHDSAVDRAFAPFDSTTLIARCHHTVDVADDSAWRAAIVRAAGREGVLVRANPAPAHPCFQIGVVAPAIRDSIAGELRWAGMPSRLVTYFHVTHVPEDDIVAGARVRDSLPGDAGATR